MRSNTYRLACVCVVSLAACSSMLGPPATLALATPPDFSATVVRVEVESGIGPEGAFSQHDVWLVIPPGTVANAGLILGKSTPVFTQIRGGIFSSSVSAIQAGDRGEVWHAFRVGYGAAEGPPGAPTYLNVEQVVIDR